MLFHGCKEENSDVFEYFTTINLRATFLHSTSLPFPSFASACHTTLLTFQAASALHTWDIVNDQIPAQTHFSFVLPVVSLSVRNPNVFYCRQDCRIVVKIDTRKIPHDM